MRTLSLQLALAGLSIPGLSVLDGSRYLWYTSPGTEWETGALPIGCGRLGATIYGGLTTEVVTLNEDTIWSGPLQERIPVDGLAALEPVREMLLSGNLTAAGQKVLRDMTPAEPSERQFSYLGNLNLGLGHANVDDYIRWLDTRRGNAGVSYTLDGVNYTREYIASLPANIIAARFTASKQGALSLNASFSRLEHILSNSAFVVDSQTGSITMSGSSGQATADHPILFTGEARFVAPGATLSASGATLVISGATTIDIFFDAETNYRYSDATALQSELDRKLSAGVAQGYDRLKKEALADSSTLLGRANIDLGTSPNGMADLPTDQRVLAARQGIQDVQLVTLVWNYGRHLLVGASRDTDADIDMPANLQGVWNNKTTASWGGKYTININLEMNYWLSGMINLVETQGPLFDLLKVAQPRGQEMAQKLYGCDGTVFHHNLDVWGDPAPTDNYTSSTMWPNGAAWLVQHMIDHYRFTGDADFLANVAYPYLKDVAAFYHCYCFEWEGHMVTGPSLSPENTFVVPANMSVGGTSEPMDIAPEMDNQLMRDVMTSLLEAAQVLGIPDSDPAVTAAKQFLPLIRPPQIGSGGQILEWRYEYQETSKGHRHLSPVYGNHPSNQFSPLVNETLSKAAKALLDRRVDGGSGSTGWSRTWLMNQYARLFSGPDVWKHVTAWFARYPTAILYNTDSGVNFQIDGNFGFTSGITEMLLQSHAFVVHLLPSLAADAVPTGSATGLLARGGFEVDMEWEGGKFKSATIVSKLGQELSLRVQDGVDFSVNGQPYTGPIGTEKGAKYVVTV